MAVKFVVNKELIAHIYRMSGKKLFEFSKMLGVSSKAVKMYLDGNYLPRNPKVLAKIQKLAQEYGAEEFAKVEVPGPTVESPESETVTESPDPRKTEFAPDVLKVYQAQMGMNVKEIAAHIGVSPDMWYKWINGSAYPSRKRSAELLRKAVFGRKNAKKHRAPPEAAAKGGKHQLPIKTAHELANEFHAQYQPRIDEATIDYALTHVCDAYDVDRRTLRKLVAALLLLLKDRFSPQELYEHLSGHSS